MQMPAEMLETAIFGPDTVFRRHSWDVFEAGHVPNAPTGINRLAYAASASHPLTQSNSGLCRVRYVAIVLFRRSKSTWQGRDRV